MTPFQNAIARLVDIGIYLSEEMRLVTQTSYQHRLQASNDGNIIRNRFALADGQHPSLNKAHEDFDVAIARAVNLSTSEYLTQRLYEYKAAMMQTCDEALAARRTLNTVTVDRITNDFAELVTAAQQGDRPTQTSEPNRIEPNTAESQLLVIRDKGLPYTSLRKLAKQCGRESPETIRKAIEGNAELRKWRTTTRPTTRQSVDADQLTDFAARTISTPDLTGALISDDEREAREQRLRNYIRSSRHTPSVEDKLLAHINALVMHDESVERIEASIDQFAEAIKDDQQDDYREKAAANARQ